MNVGHVGGNDTCLAQPGPLAGNSVAGRVSPSEQQILPEKGSEIGKVTPEAVDFVRGIGERVAWAVEPGSVPVAIAAVASVVVSAAVSMAITRAISAAVATMLIATIMV
ncbi:MAG: hypothetical protein LBF49_00010 [Puniceicoccales bacterium]|jgi:hypothetical protein|nr:hypothetical protein [Puniceicoccales bacterium]